MHVNIVWRLLNIYVRRHRPIIFVVLFKKVVR